MLKKATKLLLAVFLILSLSFPGTSYAKEKDKISKSKTETVEVYDYQTKTSSSKILTINEDNAITFSEGYTPDNQSSEGGRLQENDENIDEGLIGIKAILPGGSLTKAPNATSDPYSKVIMSRNGFDADGNGSINFWTIGSGFMVKDDVLLTACHTIWHDAYSIWVQEYGVYINQHNSSYGTTYYYPQQWTYLTNYTSSGEYYK